MKRSEMKRATVLLVLAVATGGGCATLAPSRSEDQNARFRLERGLSALETGAYTAAFDDLAWVYSHCTGREAAGQALLALAALELDPRNERARPSVGTDLLGRAITGAEAPRWTRPLAETSFLTALALGAPHPAPPAPAAEGTEPTGDTTAAPGNVMVDTTAMEAAAVDAAEPHAGVHRDPDEPATTAAEALRPQPLATGGAMPEPAYGCGPAVEAEAGDTARAVLPELPGPSMAALLSRAETRRDSLAMTTQLLQQELTLLREQLAATRAELERIRKTLKP
jgi:hypothetical protein